MIINRGCEVVAGIRENRYMSFLQMLSGSVSGQCAIGTRRNGGRFRQREATQRGELLLPHQPYQNQLIISLSLSFQKPWSKSHPPPSNKSMTILVSKSGNLSIILGHRLQPKIYPQEPAKPPPRLYVSRIGSTEQMASAGSRQNSPIAMIHRPL